MPLGTVFYLIFCATDVRGLVATKTRNCCEFQCKYTHQYQRDRSCHAYSPLGIAGKACWPETIAQVADLRNLLSSREFRIRQRPPTPAILREHRECRQGRTSSLYRSLDEAKRALAGSRPQRQHHPAAIAVTTIREKFLYGVRGAPFLACFARSGFFASPQNSK